MTRGPVNANLKLIHRIFSNTFMHVNVYSPRAGTEHPLGTKHCIQERFLVTLPN